nr:MAG TPA: hypothetical protein [Caudoviricetes sp.]
MGRFKEVYEVNKLYFKEFSYIENRKYYEGVSDYLVREYHDILNIVEEVGEYAPSEVTTYLYRELDSIPVDKKVEFLSSFFNNTLVNDIQTIKVWVSYLDTHMEDRYIEDGEMMVEYRPTIENTTLAIRGDKDSIMIFIDNILKTLHLEDNEIIEILNNIDYNNSSLPDEEFENYEPSQEEYEDRPYYEQRRRYSI